MNPLGSEVEQKGDGGHQSDVPDGGKNIPREMPSIYWRFVLFPWELSSRPSLVDGFIREKKTQRKENLLFVLLVSKYHLAFDP